MLNVYYFKILFNNKKEANVFIATAHPQVKNLKRRPYETKILADITTESFKKIIIIIISLIYV